MHAFARPLGRHGSYFLKWRFVAAAVLVCACVIGGSPALADVFEIGDTGALITRAGPGAVPMDSADALSEAADAEPAVLTQAPDVPIPAVTMVLAPEVPAQFGAAILDAARRYQVSPALLSALVWQESRWQPAALSSKGAIGLGQLMPATARALAVDPRDPSANLSGAAHYLRQMLDLFDGDVERALAAYNAGAERVLKAGGVPAIAETRAYVSRIIDRLAVQNAGAPTGVIQP